MARAAGYGSRADTALLLASLLLAMLSRVMPENVRAPVAAALRRSVAAPLVALHKRAELVRNAWLTYEQRSLARDSLAMRAMTATSLEAENARLRLLLGLGRRLEWGFIPAEALHNRGQGEEHTVTLTAGSLAGTRPFSPVVAPEGLVGMVYTADPTSSVAILWPHPDFRVSAMAEDGSAFGVVRAHPGDEVQRYLLQLSGVPFRSTLKPGTLVVSSGLGATYPRGIPIGTVLRELETPEGWVRTYLVRPAVLPPDITAVMVLTPRRVAGEVATVWSTARSDSAARGVAAAADSLARVAAVAEAAARRAAADSVRRATPTSDSLPRAARGATAAPPAPRAAPAPQGRDTARRAPVGAAPAPRDTARGTGRPDTARREAGRDTARRPGDSPAGRPDTVRRDTLRPELLRRDTASPAPPPVPRDTAQRDSVKSGHP